MTDKGRMTPTFGEFVKRRFGLLKYGAHQPNGEACVLEARNAALGRKWSDSPGDFPDLRPLNDGRWESDEQRTQHIVPVVEALWDWPGWDETRRQRWAKIVAEQMIRRVLPIALRAVGLEAEAVRCEKEGTAQAARAAEAAALAAKAEEAARAAEEAAQAAEAAARAAATWAATWAAARAAAWAAWAAASAPAPDALIIACSIFIEAARDSAQSGGDK